MRQTPNQEAIRTLYNLSFPPSERRPWNSVLALLDKGDLTIEVFYAKGAFAGFLSWWHLPGFIYIEHFAVMPDLRNQGVGGDYLDRFIKEHSDKPIILEAEPPHSSIMASRRLNFYQRHGFAPYKTYYIQPPYSAGLPPVHLWLMMHRKNQGTYEAKDTLATTCSPGTSSAGKLHLGDTVPGDTSDGATIQTLTPQYVESTIKQFVYNLNA